MGWTFQQGTVSNDEMLGILNGFYTGPNSKVLRSVLIDTEYYAAVEHTFADGSKTVYAALALVEITLTDYGYKMMDETMGPYMYNCPKAILDLLSPNPQAWGADWRAKQYVNTGERHAQSICISQFA